MASSLTRFDPFARMLRADPFRDFDDFFSDMRIPALPSLLRGDMSPRVRLDVTESDQEYKVMADLPGVKKDDIKVNIDGA